LGINVYASIKSIHHVLTGSIDFILFVNIPRLFSVYSGINPENKFYSNNGRHPVASFLREAIWPSNKILPNKWSKWREDINSLCQMILQKVAIPVGVDGQSYWEAIILGITNDKFCALRANFKQELFEQFQGK